MGQLNSDETCFGYLTLDYIELEEVLPPVHSAENGTTYYARSFAKERRSA